MASNGLVKEQHGNKDNFPTSLAMLLIFILLFFSAEGMIQIIPPSQRLLQVG
jgi:hypothetical protein